MVTAKPCSAPSTKSSTLHTVATFSCRDDGKVRGRFVSYEGAVCIGDADDTNSRFYLTDTAVEAGIQSVLPGSAF